MATAVQSATEASSTLTQATAAAEAALRTPEELARIVEKFAASDGWLSKVRLQIDHRWYERLYHGPDHDIWVISWMPGQSTGFHDHGSSAGAFVVATGILEERLAGEPPREIKPGQRRAFGPAYAHDVRNGSSAPAISIHAYSPPLEEMNEYELEGEHLVRREHLARRERLVRQPRATARSKHKAGAELLGSASAIDQMLAKARGRLHRLNPQEAYTAVTQAGALLVDIRPERQRAVEGTIEGALVVERNVLEWRFDPTSTARLPVAVDHDLQVIVFCSEGYTSSLAATALQDLGLRRATDVTGGFKAWQAAGLPTAPPANS